MTRIVRQTYSTYVAMQLEQYGDVHGLIEEFGGRVKQFSQDINDERLWRLFFEMPKTQKIEFDNAINELKDKS